MVVILSKKTIIGWQNVDVTRYKKKGSLLLLSHSCSRLLVPVDRISMQNIVPILFFHVCEIARVHVPTVRMLITSRLHRTSRLCPILDRLQTFRPSTTATRTTMKKRISKKIGGRQTPMAHGLQPGVGGVLCQ